MNIYQDKNDDKIDTMESILAKLREQAQEMDADNWMYESNHDIIR